MLAPGKFFAKQFAVKPKSWSKELFAGMSGAIGSVPDGMAAATLAGVNPMAGLFSSLAGPLVGGVLTSTPVLVIATTSAASVTTNGALTSASDRAGALALLTVLTGVMIAVATLLGVSRLMRFISASVMTGFMFGVGLILILSQISDAAGVEVSGSAAAIKAWDALSQFSDFSTYSLIITVTAILTTIVLTRFKYTRSVAPLVAIAITTAMVAVFRWDVQTVAQLGNITNGLPVLTLPNLRMMSPELFAAAVALTIVILVQAHGLSTTYRTKLPSYKAVNQDFYGHSAANVASGLIGGIPIGASVGQSALNKFAGGRTRWSVIFSGAWMVLFIFALGPLLLLVPIPSLAGLLMLAGAKSLRFKALKNVLKTGTSSLIAALITLVGTLFLPIQSAVLLGVVLSLLLVGIGIENSVKITRLIDSGNNQWTRSRERLSLASKEISIAEIRGISSFTAVPQLFQQLPHSTSDLDRGVLILKFDGEFAPNQTLIQSLNSYQADLAQHHSRVILAGIPERSRHKLYQAGLSKEVEIFTQGDVLGSSISSARDFAKQWIDNPSTPNTQGEN